MTKNHRKTKVVQSIYLSKNCNNTLFGPTFSLPTYLFVQHFLWPQKIQKSYLGQKNSLNKMYPILVLFSQSNYVPKKY